jgi:hypothetical protein
MGSHFFLSLSWTVLILELKQKNFYSHNIILKEINFLINKFWKYERMEKLIQNEKDNLLNKIILVFIMNTGLEPYSWTLLFLEKIGNHTIVKMFLGVSGIY